MAKKVLFIVYMFCFFAIAQDTIPTHIVLDSLGNEVFLILDKDKKPQHYFSAVFTPVCVDGSCYPINIELYWDLAGHYLKYGLSKDEILTKIEHLPFTDFDYGLLHRMIARSPSALANFTIYELTLPIEDKVDGVTGATRPELSGSFVPDALFTTYTLWHLVRQPKDELMSFTRARYFNADWASFIMNHSVLACRKAFINLQLSQKDEKGRAELMFSMMKKYGSNFPVELIQSLEDTDYVRAQSIELYQKTDNSQLKLTILSKWKQEGIQEAELIAITKTIGACHSCFNQELSLIRHFEHWPEDVYPLLYAKIENQPNMMRREKLNTVLEERSEMYPKAFRKMMKKKA